MPAPVKISDRLLARAKEEAKSTQRSVTAQIEHWATLGRAVEMIAGHGEVLALKRAGERLTLPPYVGPQDVHDALTRMAEDPDRDVVKARIRAAGGPIYSGDPHDPDVVIEIAPDGRRTRGRFEGGRFVRHRAPRPVRVAARRRR